MNDIMDYTDNGIQEIENSQILHEGDFEKLASIKDALMETWIKDKVFRSETDMRYSVLNDTRFPTRAHKYLQARHEQDVHFRNLIYLSCDYQEKQGELMRLEGELEELEDSNEKNEKIRKGKIIEKKAEIKRCKFQLQEMRKVAHHRVREVTTWEKIKRELDDGSFDPDDYDMILPKAYELRWSRELESEMVSGNPDGTRVGVLRGSLSSLNKGKKELDKNGMDN